MGADQVQRRSGSIFQTISLLSKRSHYWNFKPRFGRILRAEIGVVSFFFIFTNHFSQATWPIALKFSHKLATGDEVSLFFEDQRRHCQIVSLTISSWSSNIRIWRQPRNFIFWRTSTLLSSPSRVLRAIGFDAQYPSSLIGLLQHGRRRPQKRAGTRAHTTAGHARRLIRA